MNRTKSYLIPAVVTFTLHALLLLMLGWGWQSTPPEKLKKQQISVVKAKLVKLKASPAKKQKKSKSTSQAKKDDKKKKAEAKKRRDAEKRRKVEKEKKRKVEQKRKAEQKKKQEKKRKEAEKRKKAEADKKRKADQEKKRKEEAARKRKEEERRQRELKEQRRLQAQQQLSDALDDEEEFFQDASDEQQAQSFMSVIQQAVERQWSRPPSARNNMQVELVIQLIPTGQVVNVTVAKGSGNAAFDRSAINAVKKAERFPELQQLKGAVFERYFRSFRLIFRPEDLRQ